MKKLSKEAIKERDEICVKLREASLALDNAVADFNNVKQAEWDKVSAAQDAYNEARTDAQSWMESVASDIQSYMDERSEKWRESDRGQEYEHWKSEYEAEIEEASIDEPDDLNLDIEDAADTLEQLPEEI